MATGLRRSEAIELECVAPNPTLHANLDTDSASVLSAFIQKYRMCCMSESELRKTQPPMRTTNPGRDQIGILYQTISDFDMPLRGHVLNCVARGCLSDKGAETRVPQPLVPRSNLVGYNIYSRG